MADVTSSLIGISINTINVWPAAAIPFPACQKAGTESHSKGTCGRFHMLLKTVFLQALFCPGADCWFKSPHVLLLPPQNKSASRDIYQSCQGLKTPRRVFFWSSWDASFRLLGIILDSLFWSNLLLTCQLAHKQHCWR